MAKRRAERHRAGLVVRALGHSPLLERELKLVVIPGIKQDRVSKCDVNACHGHDVGILVTEITTGDDSVT